MAEQQGFEFCGGDLVALVFDEFLDPVDDGQPAVGVDAADVAGVHPPVGVDHVGGGVELRPR